MLSVKHSTTKSTEVNNLSIVDNLFANYNTTDPYRLIKYLDISLIEMPLPSNTLGMTIRNDGEATIIVNNTNTSGGQLFTLSHELGHVILHPSESTTFYREQCHGVQIPKMEAEAHRFALDLLTHNAVSLGLEINVYNLLHHLNLPDSMDRFLIK